MAVNWLELAAPNSTVPLDNYALVLNNNFNYTGGMVYEAENTFTVEFMVKPKVAHQIDVESTSGTGGTDGQKYVMFPVQGGSEADSRAGMGISVGTNGVSVYEHADYYMPALLVWEYPIDTVWTHVAVVYHNGKPSLYINGVWKKDGLQSLKQHVYPGTMFPGGYYGSQGDGILDEVRIWSVARTPAQIAANKDGELTGPQTGLVGYWPMNEGTGLTLHDVSGSGRDVDLTSAGYTSASWTNGRYSVASIIGSYRYEFNGKEKDSDIGENDYDYGARIHDARLGRWLSTDPLQKKYADLSPYNYCTNSPVAFYDPDGKIIVIHYTDQNGKPASIKYTPGIQPATKNTFVQQVHEAVIYAMKNDDERTFQNLSANKNTLIIQETSLKDDKTDLTKFNGRVINSKSKGYTDEKANSLEVTICWNPNIGLRTLSGGAISPSTALLHEGGHGILDFNSKTLGELLDNSSPTYDDYQYKSDKQIITGLETNYINKTNLNSKAVILPNGDVQVPQQQSTRKTHILLDLTTDLYPTTGVNSITPRNSTVVINGTEFIIKNPIHTPIPKNSSDHPEDTRNMRSIKLKLGVN